MIRADTELKDLISQMPESRLWCAYVEACVDDILRGLPHFGNGVGPNFRSALYALYSESHACTELIEASNAPLDAVRDGVRNIARLKLTDTQYREFLTLIRAYRSGDVKF